MDDDVDEARMQLRQALAHCAQDREELDRLRKMLQQERETAQRREREIEELQTSNAEEVAKLNETLRKAEQVSWRSVACVASRFVACVPPVCVPARGTLPNGSTICGMPVSVFCVALGRLDAMAKSSCIRSSNAKQICRRSYIVKKKRSVCERNTLRS